MSVPLWVLDTNVLVSAVLSPGRVCDQLLQQAIAGRFLPAWDNTLLKEYRDVLLRPKFGLPRSAVRDLSASLPKSGFRQGLANVDLILPDPSDLAFVAVALATEDRTIITGNPRHFPATSVTSVAILSPREALDRLAKLEMSRGT